MNTSLHSLRHPLALIAFFLLSACAQPQKTQAPNKPITQFVTLTDAELAQRRGSPPNIINAMDADFRLGGEIRTSAFSPGHGGYPEYLQRMQNAFDAGRFKVSRGANIQWQGRMDYVGKGGPRYANGAAPTKHSTRASGQPTATGGRQGFEQALQQKMKSGQLSTQEVTITYPDGTKRKITR